MNRCPITYEVCGEERYSRRGLNQLARGLTRLNDLPFTAEEQREEAVARTARMSIQGVQPKLSARLKVREGSLEVVDIGGRYILKPQSALYPEVPENEDLTMKLAATVGIETPSHGMIYSKDGTRTYFIRRFDRFGRKRKLPVEDLAQLSGATRDTKYTSSMEKASHILDFCTFPVLEKLKFFRLTLFCFLTGNEDMHLKNFSLITQNSKIELSPAYDLLNTTLILPNPQEETALPLNGKRRNLTRHDLVDYFALERLNLPSTAADDVLNAVQRGLGDWEEMIQASFLSDSARQAYLDLTNQRAVVLGLSS